MAHGPSTASTHLELTVENYLQKNQGGVIRITEVGTCLKENKMGRGVGATEPTLVYVFQFPTCK